MRKVRNKKKDLKKLYVLAIVIVSFMAAGYAILQATLTINGTFGTNTTWDVYIESITKTNSLYTARELAAPSIDQPSKMTANFSVDLKAPGDQIEYDIVVRNASNIDAYLKTINFSCTDANNNACTQSNTGLTYSYTGLQQGDKLRANRTATLHLTLKIPMSDTTLPTVKTKNLSLTLTYEQTTPVDIAALPILRTTSQSATQYLNHSLTKADVESITIVDSKTVPAGAIDSWGVAEGTDATKIMAYTMDSDSDSKYELYIGGDGGVQANTISSYLFQGFTNVTSITGLDNLYTDNVTTMEHMFSNCSSLNSLDLSGFNTSSVENMNFMFNCCSNLTNLDLSNFNTSNAKYMYGMFCECSSLTSLDLSNFNTSNVITMRDMFYYCSGLTSLNVSNFNTSNVTSMQNMFGHCDSLTSLDLSSFNTSSEIVMTNMFLSCSNLVNLSVGNGFFNVSTVTSTSSMFSGCTKLVTTLYIPSTSIVFYNSMFRNAATQSGAQVTINYTSANSSLVDNLIATKSSGSNVVKGSVIPTS